MELWISMIKEVGFPIGVTLYLLYRIEQKLDHVIFSIKELPNQMYHK
ncbi:YvrJ family protein [Bacillus sp. JJ664]